MAEERTGKPSLAIGGIDAERTALAEQLRVLLLVSLAVGLVGLAELAWNGIDSGSWLGGFSRGHLLRMIPLALLSGLAFVLALPFTASARDRLATGLDWLTGAFARLGWGNYLLCLLPLAAFSWAALHPSDGEIARVFPRVWLFAHAAFLGAVFWQAARPSGSLLRSVAVVLLVYGVGHRAAAFIPDVQAYPFTLSWSEGSRYYYASLFFAQPLYGQSAALPTLHPTRYLMQSVPFVIPALPLWFHRLWQVLLWLGMTGLGAWLLARRLGRRLSRRLAPPHQAPGPKRSALPGLGTALAAAFGFVFLFQGPVYYHLMVCVVLVLWGALPATGPEKDGAEGVGVGSRSFWRTLGVVVLASLWAGISRVNWFPVPALLASLLYLLAVPLRRQWLWRYLLPPFLWVAAGLLSALAAQAAYALVSGNELEAFGSSFSSSLLWYRLLPSATYPVGILLGIGLAALPFTWALWHAWRVTRLAVNPLRWLGVAAILAVFLAGGLLVSVKIGGGSNLHNMDAFLVLLLVAGGTIYSGGFVPDRPGKENPHPLPGLALALLIAIPLIPVVQAGAPLNLPDSAVAQANLHELQQLIDEAPPGEVLFISERQLLPFHLVEGVSLVEEYEKVFLMEMAMAGNPRYLGELTSDLRRHRFALIITEPLNTNLQTSVHSFGEENNVWVEHISTPVLAYYEEVARLDEVGIQVLRPKP